MPLEFFLGGVGVVSEQDMNPGLRISRPACLAVVAAVLACGPSPVSAEPLITGTATYALELAPGKQSVAAFISGDMTYALKRECTAYRIEAALDLKISGPTGEVPMTMRSTLVEDGKALDFDIAGDVGGNVIEKARGTATQTDGGLTVAVSSPSEKSFVVPGPVYFPVAVVEEAIAAAKAGRTFADYRVFDGSGNGEEVWALSVLIVPVPASADLGEEALFAAGLGFEDLDRWRMTFTYFKPGGTDQTPAFSTEAVVYANGFALATVYDLGPVALKLKLIDFSPVPPKPCA
jgi:hypothetical protein